MEQNKPAHLRAPGLDPKFIDYFFPAKEKQTNNISSKAEKRKVSEKSAEKPDKKKDNFGFCKN